MRLTSHDTLFLRLNSHSAMNHRTFPSILASLVLSAVAHADIVSYFTSMPEASISSTPAVTQLTLPAFNSSLGTLTGVKLSFVSELWQEAQVENLSNSTANYSFFGTATISLDRADGVSLLAPTELQMPRSTTLGAFDGVIDYSGSSGIAFNQYGSFSGQYNDSNLTSYLGTGTVSFEATGQALAQLSASSGSLLAGSSAMYATGLSVDYSYIAGDLTQIPEPPLSGMLAGLAVLVGVVVLRGRRQAAAR
jgi:hypothetical protein